MDSGLMCKSLLHSELLFFFFFDLFLGLYPWHVEVLSQGVTSELQWPAYTAATATRDLSRICNLHHSSQQHWTLNPLSEAKDGTRILMDTSWVHYR